MAPDVNEVFRGVVSGGAIAFRKPVVDRSPLRWPEDEDPVAGAMKSFSGVGISGRLTESRHVSLLPT
jgi:hypothetical protein